MQQDTGPLYHFEGEIDVKEAQGFTQGYLDFPFEVPPGTRIIRLHLDYTPLSVGKISNLITLGLFDPLGFRGNAHRHPPDREVLVSAEAATVGFLPGSIRAGKWLAQLAIQSVVADESPCRYSLDIALIPGREADHSAQVWMPVQQSAADHPGWFRGELHSHTVHSDGSLSLAELIEQAHERKLDFLAITDHNTTSALSELQSTVQDGLLIVPGIELTTFHGHALVLGVDRWVDWRTGYNHWTMDDAARVAHSLGGLFIPAHPNDLGSPLCTGCRWEYTDFDLHLADAIEIWNGPWFEAIDSNPQSLKLWRSQQEKSHQLPATAGADFHRGKDWGPGRPAVYVYAEALSIPAILEGIRQGRLMLTNGPWLTVQVTSADERHHGTVGDTVETTGNRVVLSIGWENVPLGARLEIRGRAGAINSEPVSNDGKINYRVDCQPEDALWLELYGEDGSLLALTNPVYVKSRENTA